MGNGFTDFVGGVASSAGDLFVGAVGGETSAQEEARLAREEAAKHGRQDLRALTQEQRNLELNGHDPASITQQDNWKNWDQARLATQLKPSLNPEQIAKSGQAWEKLGNDIAEIFGDLDQKARAAAGDGMRGQAAEAGFNAAKPLQEWGRAFGDSVRGTGLKIQEAGVAAEQTKASLQPPAGYDSVRGGLSAAMGPSGMLIDSTMQMREQKEADQQARQVAENVYAKSYQAVDTSTPTFPPPVNPLAPPPPPPGGDTPGGPGAGTGSGSGSGTGGGGYSGSSVGGGPGGGGYSGSAPAQSSAQWASPSPAGPGAGGGMPPGMTPGQGGPAAGFAGAMPPGAGAGAGRGAGGMGGARGAGAGMGAGGKAGAGMGAGGRSGMGGLGAGSGSGGAAGAGAGGRGAAGAPGAGAGAGRGKGGEEDNEHERPSWLEEQEDIWMDDMPKTAPPVFGE
ncbi:hypothetical protein [Saccharopolyspora flava]|uniref:PPE family protein n=1 Tax=Saccharopolyspora flava TaxID=95161 RepID=A0A1I6PUH7_9PSEU|nr:hypothetical protein [Saccharopolyspora flava]SFS43705.1 hypothetical protein SAMN05660874_01108 [Saccharopolyspora flava]